MSVHIELDSREGKLMKLLADKYQRETLVVGDVQFTYANQTLLTLERKTIKDLESSLKDGRYREQKQRLMKSSALKTGYIIEGNSRIDFKSCLDSICIGLQYRDQQLVFRTSSLEHTADLILKLKSKLEQYLKDNPELFNQPLTQIGGSEYQPTVNKCPRENITPEICYRMALAGVPSVSYKFADEIAKIYPNFKSLMGASVTDLAKVKVSEKRRLGPVASKNIFTMFQLD